jgi:signal transduction histidine kinase
VRVVVSLRDTRAREVQERSRANLVSTVAHELRSPLTSVKGFTATLLAKWDRFDDEHKKLMLTTVNADADRVTRLITELLDVSRIDAGRLEMRVQVVDLEQAVRKAVAGRIASGDPEESFVVEVQPGTPETWADPDKLQQVVGNLLENAVRHGEGTVSVVLRPHGDGSEITVADEGVGIPPEKAGRVFTRFWRGGDRRGGTGLGPVHRQGPGRGARRHGRGRQRRRRGSPVPGAPARRHPAVRAVARAPRRRNRRDPL